MDPDPLLRQTLLLDLEVAPNGRIREVGAVLGELVERPSPAAASAALARLASQAVCVLGHNILAHDLEVLRQLDPDHPLHHLPVIDTLILSPLCFPENPYHRLVKDYKLVRESLSDPVADARQAVVLFRDEIQSLTGLRETEPRLFEAFHFLLATPGGATEWTQDRHAAGMDLLFRQFEAVRPSLDCALESCRELVRRAGCRNVPLDEALVRTPDQRLALAFVLAWLRVAGSCSVLPPWVRLQYPETGRLIEVFREVPCTDAGCAWCRRTHDPRAQLEAFFGFRDFRPIPTNASGDSLQRDIIEAGMRHESLLAILPTGGGKSLCYQLPALVRNHRRGVLTIVISPLQSLMKDQVDGLVRRTGTTATAALYGLLTTPERGDVLRRVRLGDIAILYVSPEQLRNRSFRGAIAQREIGCWVFDEAHCLSKWGHDFRPDYLYAGRFIREFAREQGTGIPAIACFTATAKCEVRDEILEHFRNETGRELLLFEGGVERDNLDFEVQAVPEHAKLERLQDLLSDRLGQGPSGSAIVFHSTREAAEVSAAFLTSKGWRVAHFHAGLNPFEKKRIQDEFLIGQIQVICATNAFGMGIDKEDVRLVIHADTPGSLENYLQEAGRAGRDGRRAGCVLLFDEADCEAQFRMGARSEISRRDIAQILRGLRKQAARGHRDELVITTGEILRDEDVDTDIELRDRSADTKVRAALSWLERAGFLQRDENVTHVFQARPLVRNLEEARVRMVSLNLSVAEQALWLAILREMLNAPGNESLTVDELALLPEFAAFVRGVPGMTTNPEYLSGRILKILGSMAQVGLLQRDTLLNAFVRHRVADHSGLRLERVLRTERAMLDLLAVEEPDPEGWLALSLRLLNQRLLDEQHPSSPEMLRDLLRSLAEDGRGFAGSHGSIELHHLGNDAYRVRVRRSWKAIGELAEKRRRVAVQALEVIQGKIPPDTGPSAELLVPFAFEDIRAAIDRDLLLRSELKDMEAAIARGLLFLHEQHVIQLQHGLAVFRSAMTLRLQPGRQGERYQTSDYQPLEHHYQERVLQVHVMGEYARQGLERIREARALVVAYFTLEKEAFIRRFLSTRPELLAHATTAQSFERIVTALGNEAQIRIVTAPIHRNLLILAGPGSGKTRTVVHRCAYLLRVERVRPQSVLVCCFNRAAAIELRRRLTDLVGADARGVTIQTYHGLALRLLGGSAAGRADSSGAGIDFDALIADAVQLLKGEKVPPGMEPDEVRDRLLAGFQHILVDEYQDIDAPQYEMISALAGRTLDDADQKLSILAVGDDDQNIYAFRGANVQFIRRFQQDYAAEVHHLVENYRATRYLIDVANRLIAANRDRMKTEHPIRIDRHRELLPAGGTFAEHDPLTRGRVQVIRLASPTAQPGAVLEELRRLRQLGVERWSSMAVLSSTHLDLAQIRALAEEAGIPVRWQAARGSLPALHQIREVHRFLHALTVGRPAGDGSGGSASPSSIEGPSLPASGPAPVASVASVAPLGSLVRAAHLIQLADAFFAGDLSNPWVRFLRGQLEAWGIESGDAELPLGTAREFLYEACADRRRDHDYGEGVVLSTVHAAKGSEFDHVILVGPWPVRGDLGQQEEQRRAFYVGLTRARQTVAVLDQGGEGGSLPGSLDGPGVIVRESPGVPVLSSVVSGYETLGLEDLHLGYPARFPGGHPVHLALARLQPGDRLRFRRDNRHGDDAGILLVDVGEHAVARLSRRGEAAWRDRLETVRDIRVLAIVHRRAEQEPDPVRRERLRVAEWEVPVVEVVMQALG